MLGSNIKTLVKRSESGPFIKEDDFDRLLMKTVAGLKEKYDIQYDPESIIPEDKELVNRIFQAGLEVIKEVGVYNLTTKRRIKFSEEELKNAINNAPGILSLGRGKDRVAVSQRETEGMTPGLVRSGPTGTPCSEEYYPLLLQSCAQEPLVDCIGGGTVSTYRGNPVIPGSPLEILAAKRDATTARRAIEEVGRPGLHICDVAVPLTCSGKMATYDEKMGLRSGDAILVSQLPELKTDYDQLSRVAYLKSRGLHVVNLMTPLLGGLGGGPEGTGIISIASHILGVICYGASYHDMGPMSLRWSHNTDRMGLWVCAVTGQVLAKHTPIISLFAIYTRAGMGSEEYFWEVASGTIASTVCGLHQMGIGARGGSVIDQTSGLTARFNAQVARASLGLKIGEARSLITRCLEKYEEKTRNPSPGNAFSELYDLKNLEPKEQFLENYYKVCKELRDLGLNLDSESNPEN